jgi:hypothetical protein
MHASSALLAILALVVPIPQAPPVVPAAHEADPVPSVTKFGGSGDEGEAFRTFRESFRPETQAQVRIEQHVMIRLVPSPPAMRREMLAPPMSEEGQVRYKEKKLGGGCVPLDDIAGIAPLEANRLLLFMRDRRMLSATLERVCDPDAFYLGAYVERNADGRLCTGRDTLRARTGAACQISRISRLVPKKH